VAAVEPAVVTAETAAGSGEVAAVDSVTAAGSATGRRRDICGVRHVGGLTTNGGPMVTSSGWLSCSTE